MSIAEYVSALRKNLAHGDATEHTHRPAMKSLLESVGKKITATNEPKRIACGAPDFIITRNNVPIGHVETKDVGTPLEHIEQENGPNKDQFKRYLDGLPNWILTDYLEFRWYVGGEHRLTGRLGTYDRKKKNIQLQTDGEAEVAKILGAFITQPALTVESAEELADKMAGMTRVVRELIAATFQHGSATDQKQLQSWLAAFKEVLIPDLDETDFSDMFAQTLAYGLFAARIHSFNSDEPFSREMAAFNLPKTNPFLRKLFAEIAGVDMPDTFDWAVDDLVSLLNHANWGKVLKDFGKGKAKHDPVVHFYETFLNAYDPELRELRGVYYTPEPVVSYIVKSIDILLQKHFGNAKGLADEKTLILDPAVGTATFLFFVIQQIYGRFAKQKGAWDGYVSKHLLNRVFGFELLMAPYAVAHLKLGVELQETGYKFGSEQRLGIYLTNTLEEAATKSEKLFGWISEEANAAADIKRALPILVVLGNPPYSGHSANRGRDKNGKLTFIGGLIEDYKEGCPELHKPAQAKWLQDDYVKFIRFSQWRIDRTGHGILGFITNHGYLDNPTFRGMRQKLMASFAEIYVYDLHGSSKKKEHTPEGNKDENVFDIQQGVAILLAVKKHQGHTESKVRHADLWGLRNQKYSVLSESNIEKTKWTELNPTAPLNLFVPENPELRAEYEVGWRLPEVFGLNGDPAPGIVTTQDEFAIAFTEEDIRANVNSLLETRNEDEARERFRLCSQSQWNYAEAVNMLKGGGWTAQLTPILYRPFDVRWTVFNRYVAVHRRERVMRHMLAGHNIGLLTARSNRSPTKDHFFCSRLITETKCGESTIQSYLFPLYLYPKNEGQQSQLPGSESRIANLTPEFIAKITTALGLTWSKDGAGDLINTLGPADVFNYAYAVFHCPTYRNRYAHFLTTDFPRLQITTNSGLFRQLAGIGHELTMLHLMETPKLDHLITEFPVTGDNTVVKVAHTPGNSRVAINSLQYFGGVPQKVWNFTVGGYQVCEKWLKDRRGRALTYDDIEHWQRIIVALNETVRLMDELDALIPTWPLS